MDLKVADTRWCRQHLTYSALAYWSRGGVFVKGFELKGVCVPSCSYKYTSTFKEVARHMMLQVTGSESLACYMSTRNEGGNGTQHLGRFCTLVSPEKIFTNCLFIIAQAPGSVLARALRPSVSPYMYSAIARRRSPLPQIRVHLPRFQSFPHPVCFRVVPAGTDSKRGVEQQSLPPLHVQAPLLHPDVRLWVRPAVLFGDVDDALPARRCRR